MTTDIAMMSFFEKDFYNDLLEAQSVSSELVIENTLSTKMPQDCYYSKYKIEKTCRVCLAQSTDLQQLFVQDKSSNISSNYLYMFISCTSLNVSLNDQYPKHICEKCIVELSRAYKFWKKCRETVHILNQQQIDMAEMTKLNNETPHKFNCLTSDELTLNTKEQNTELINKQNYIEKLKIQLKELDELEIRRKSYLMQPQNKNIESPYEQNSAANDSKLQRKVKKNLNQTRSMAEQTIESDDFCEIKIKKESSTQENKKINSPRKYRLSFKNLKKKTKYLCPECGRVVIGSTGFQAHVASHSEVRPYKCKHCDKKYKSFSSLQVHIRNHTGERRYTCKHCNAKFITWNSLSSHIKTHHSNARPHVCDICSKAFKYSGSLIVHKRQHTGEKPYACTECTWAFASPGSLRMHMAKHTGERKYPCPLCEKRFTKAYAVKVHMVTHTGERNHKCNICGKAFTQAHVLRSHMKTHQDQHHVHVTNTSLESNILG